MVIKLHCLLHVLPNVTQSRNRGHFMQRLIVCTESWTRVLVAQNLFRILGFRSYTFCATDVVE